MTAHANDLGLLSEEIDVQDHSLIGNFPQALSHVGLINAAWAIAQAKDQAPDLRQKYTAADQEPHKEKE